MNALVLELKPKTSVWATAGWPWRICAVAGLLLEELGLLTLLLVVGVSIKHADSHDLPFFWGYALGHLVLMGVALLCWADMVRSGRYAWLWALPWPLQWAAMVLLDLGMLGGVEHLQLGDMITMAVWLGIALTQVWVGLSAFARRVPHAS